MVAYMVNLVVELLGLLGHELTDELDILAKISPLFVEKQLLGVIEHGKPQVHGDLQKSPIISSSFSGYSSSEDVILLVVRTLGIF
jgi:hypothetical protein